MLSYASIVSNGFFFISTRLATFPGSMVPICESGSRQQKVRQTSFPKIVSGLSTIKTFRLRSFDEKELWGLYNGLIPVTTLATFSMGGARLLLAVRL